MWKGHESTVEDVVFQPGSAAELASVGDDYALLLWDTRAGPGPSTQIPEAHKQQDVQCVDWSAQDTNMIATGVACTRLAPSCAAPAMPAHPPEPVLGVVYP